MTSELPGRRPPASVSSSLPPELPMVPRDSAARVLGQWARKHPGGTLALILGLMGLVAVIVGFCEPGLQIFLLALLFASLWCGYTAFAWWNQEERARWLGALKLCGGLAFWTVLILYMRASTHRETVESTAQYWEEAVAKLHNLRFGSHVAPHQDGLLHLEQFLHHAQKTIDQASTYSTEGVDHELALMARRHLRCDKACVSAGTSLLRDLRNAHLTPEENTAFQQISLNDLVELLKHYSAGERMPGQVEASYAPILIEIQQMQAKLEERYRRDKRTFPLPSVQSGPTRTPAR